ncbi:arabinan endo-1,5-alpha-L-arabinosidase [Chloroflexi bacterium TSY]|nr:arabinan endo-1,5-alpha-L-arabinosidase [Chloroflexi bacterium TSY]
MIVPPLVTILLTSCMSWTQSFPEADNPDPPLLAIYNKSSLLSAKSSWHIHDPTQVVKLDDYWMIGVTGKAQSSVYRCGLEIWYIGPDDEDWMPGQCVFTEKPDWIAEELPGNDGAFWAPGFLSPRVIYYSVSGGEQAQCIGFAKAKGNPPNLQWIDVGQPITCTFAPEESPDKAPNSIDPDAFVAQDGTHYLVYGAGRIYITPLDPETGLQIDGEWWYVDAPNYHFVADKPLIPDPNGNDWIEAPFVFHHDGYYYLFVNWYGCCDGLDSTYEIRMGRSEEPTGPYVDADGVDLTDGGGTLLIRENGKYIGPGHAAISELDDGRFLFSFHYYNRENEGLPWISIRELRWEDGWPALDAEEFDLASLASEVRVVLSD